jgi:hypothetical protein
MEEAGVACLPAMQGFSHFASPAFSTHDSFAAN